MANISLSKNEAIKKVKQVKTLLNILDQQWPSTGVQNFYAYFDSVNGIFWFCVTNHWIWINQDFVNLIEDMKIAATDSGFAFTECYVHPVARYEHQRDCVKNKNMFISL